MFLGGVEMANLESIGGLHYEMMRRCYNEKNVAYNSYGGKGIKVCEEWHDREVFRKWCECNGWEKGLRLNRIDGNGDYCPQNCVFGNKNCKIDGGKNQKVKKTAKERKQKKLEFGIKGNITDDELYCCYRGMRNRCESKTHPSYNNYGGRGITVCEEWRTKEGFFNFKKWAIENGWSVGLTLDRIDNNSGYCPSNCKWSTALQQSYNKRNNILYKYANTEMPLGMIARLENVKYGLLYTRVRLKGMKLENALSEIKSGK